MSEWATGLGSECARARELTRVRIVWLVLGVVHSIKYRDKSWAKDGFEIMPHYDGWLEARGLVGQLEGLERFSGPMPGALHCRPEGGEQSRWIK